MQIQRKSLIKWSIITVICGGSSFYWGFMVTNGKFLPMILGMLTLILMFSFIESHPRYQAKRAGNALLARALDLGVKIRVCLGLYTLLIFAVLFISEIRLGKPWEMILSLPYIGELFIGMGASRVTKLLTGVELGQAQPDKIMFLPTYLTTIFTGLAHTAILALLCALIYGVSRLLGRRKAVNPA